MKLKTLLSLGALMLSFQAEAKTTQFEQINRDGSILCVTDINGQFTVKPGPCSSPLFGAMQFQCETGQGHSIFITERPFRAVEHTVFAFGKKFVGYSPLGSYNQLQVNAINSMTPGQIHFHTNSEDILHSAEDIQSLTLQFEKGTKPELYNVECVKM